jgi:hypothetical protein
LEPRAVAVIVSHQLEDEVMRAVIKALRQLADECESRAKTAADYDSKLNLVLLATDCHWLAGKADQSAAEHVDRFV